MTVTPDGITGTVGGGHLEFDAIARARTALDGGELEDEVRYPLGPGLGQCCGGVVWLRFERVASGDDLQARLPRRADAAAGGVRRGPCGPGHRPHRARPAAGPALDRQPRRTSSPRNLQRPTGTRRRWTPSPTPWPDLAPGSTVLIMSYSHAEDFNLVAACLKRQRERGDLAFIGLIGSKTKWASFRHRLEARGFTADDLAQVVCPIGVPGVAGKQPAVIAVAVLAQMLALPSLPASP